MAGTPRKRRVGIVEPPDVCQLRTPSPKRGRIGAHNGSNDNDPELLNFTRWDEYKVADFMQTKGCSTAANTFRGK